MISLLTPFAACALTLTIDNGKELAQHARIAKALGADFFFAHPDTSWGRRANENMNGLISHFFQKKMHCNSMAAKDITRVMHLLTPQKMPRPPRVQDTNTAAYPTTRRF